MRALGDLLGNLRDDSVRSRARLSDSLCLAKVQIDCKWPCCCVYIAELHDRRYASPDGLGVVFLMRLSLSRCIHGVEHTNKHPTRAS